MKEVGDKFGAGELILPFVLQSAEVMKKAVAHLEKFLDKVEGVAKGKVVLATVYGDVHDIGKNLVIMMFEGGGFEVVDLGVDVSPEKFVEAIQKHKPQVVGISALLTTTMREMKTALEAIAKAGLKNQVKTIVGGAPLTEKFAKEIGADGYAPDAASAVDVVKSLLN
jgi:5-methyltetrahydrofolate--homocysteine methyltransferase